MTIKRKPYRTYTKAFKVEAVKLMDADGRTPSEIASELGVRRNQLYKWKEQLVNKGELAFSGHTKPPRKQDDLVVLRRENERLKEELEILKKAAVDSTGHCNRSLNNLLWRSKIQCFSRPFI